MEDVKHRILKGGKNKMAEKGKKPIFKVRSGGISASLWENTVKKDGKEFNFKTVTLQRSYTKDEGKTFENENINFRPQDLIKLLTVLGKIQDQLFLKEDLKEVEE